MDLMTSTSIDGLSADAQMEKALLHVARQIKNDPFIGWYMGLGTETFSLVTEALATRKGEALEHVRKCCLPLAPRNPAAAHDADPEG
jgi:hypothetical protein